MKVIKQEDEYWDIIDNDKVVATIESEWRYNKAGDKVLYIGKKRIGSVANQKEAILKVKQHLMENANN